MDFKLEGHELELKQRPKTIEELQPKKLVKMMNDQEENDLMSRLDYLKLNNIFTDYDILGGDEGLDLKTFIAVMTRKDHLGVKED
jgi:hypothetical protein